MRTVAVLLAAGGGTRFEGPLHKLLAPLHGRPVVRHAVDHALAADVGPVVVVTGAVGLGLDREPVTGADEGDLLVLHNPRWAEGQSTSLAMGVSMANELGAEAIVLALGDQPFIPAEAWRAVASAAPEHQIVVASYDGQRGPHPVRLHRSVWAELPTTGDDGARTLIREHAARVHEVPCTGSAADIDTLEDLQRWTSS